MARRNHSSTFIDVSEDWDAYRACEQSDDRISIDIGGEVGSPITVSLLGTVAEIRSCLRTIETVVNEHCDKLADEGRAVPSRAKGWYSPVA